MTLHSSIPSKWTRRVWVANCCWTPLATPGKPLTKQTVGIVAASHDLPTLQALESSLNSGTAKRGCLGRGKAFEWLRQICPPKNSHVHVHMIELCPINLTFTFGEIAAWLQLLESDKGISKNQSSQVFGKVPVNFSVWGLATTLHFVNVWPDIFREILGGRLMTSCYWKALFLVPKVTRKKSSDLLEGLIIFTCMLCAFCRKTMGGEMSPEFRRYRPNHRPTRCTQSTHVKMIRPSQRDQNFTFSWSATWLGRTHAFAGEGAACFACVLFFVVRMQPKLGLPSPLRPPKKEVKWDTAFLLTIGSSLFTAELFAYSGAWELFLLTSGAILVTIGAFCLQFKLFHLQWESASNKHLNGV